MLTYWKCTDDGEDVIELPSESDGTLMLSTLSAQYPGASGLKYKSEESGSFRGVRLVDGRLHPPEEEVHSVVYHCVFPKDKKRKLEEEEEEESQTKRLDNKIKCSDLIILGLPYKTTEEQVREYFQPFGELLLVQVKRHPETGRSKGFGFIRFANVESQAKAICTRHLIDGRWCEVKIANAKNDTMGQITTKIFVGRLTEDITEKDLNEYFSQYGQVLDVYIPKPFRGFAFVNFADPMVAYQLCSEDHIIKQVSVFVSKAAPRGENTNKNKEKNRGPGDSYMRSSQNYPGDNMYRGPPGDMRSPSNGHPPGNDDLANLTPALLAAAFNSSNLRNLLSNLQSNERQNYQSWDNQGSGNAGGSYNWQRRDVKDIPDRSYDY